MTEKEIKRGYVKWTDDDGVFHKEPLADHPELLAKASPREQIAAEEVVRLNEAAAKQIAETEAEAEGDEVETLEALKSAPDHILTTGQLTVAEVDGEEIIVPVDEVEPLVLSAPEPLWSEDHNRALEQLKKETTK